MKGLFAAILTLGLFSALLPDIAEAARVGGGRSVGAQRAAPMQRQATPPAAAPQQAQKAAPAAAPAPAQPQGNRWLGPLAGLAAGLGLGWLLGQGGMGGMVGTLLMALLAGVVVMMLVRMFAKRREEPVAQMQYAGLGSETVAAPPPSQLPVQESAAQGPVSAAQIPAGFDVEGFLKQARRNFVQMQDANDRADLAEMREITTAEMFESLKGDVAARSGRQQQTEVITLNASLLEVVTEGSMHWASVRFSGSLRESPAAPPEAFEEVWNLQKPVSGETGWLLAGIQQVS